MLALLAQAILLFIKIVMSTASRPADSLSSSTLLLKDEVKIGMGTFAEGMNLMKEDLYLTFPNLLRALSANGIAYIPTTIAARKKFMGNVLHIPTNKKPPQKKLHCDGRVRRTQLYP